tara:strand:+ start:946 stop:1911 length:966 start_codon:yes stop_codon:yes gene_type:complete
MSLLKLLKVLEDLSEPVVKKKVVRPEQFSGEGLASLLNQKPLYHGSFETGLPKLVLPDKHTQRIKVDYGNDFTKRNSPGGIYATQKITDSRLPTYSGGGGSVYELQPSFEKTLLAGRGKMPMADRREIQRLIRENQQIWEDNRGILSTLSPRKRKDMDNALQTEEGLEYLLTPTYGNSILATKDFNKGLANMGYDSVLFPKKANQGTMGSGTAIILDPDKVKIAREFDPEYHKLRAKVEMGIKDPKEKKDFLKFLDEQDEELDLLYNSNVTPDLTRSIMDKSMFKRIMRDPKNIELLEGEKRIFNTDRILDGKEPMFFKAL